MTLRRWLALCGVGTVLLFAVAFFSTSTPDDSASAAKVVSYYRDHRGAANVGNLAELIAGVLLVLFAVRLREFLGSDQPDGGLLPNVAFGGALILSAGFLLDAGVSFALVRSARQGFTGSAQTLNMVANDSVFVVTGGAAILLLGAGIATVRRPALPRWLGWFAVVIGVLALPGPFGVFAAVAAMIWLLVVAILIFRRKDEVPVGGAEVSAAT